MLHCSKISQVNHTCGGLYKIRLFNTSHLLMYWPYDYLSVFSRVLCDKEAIKQMYMKALRSGISNPETLDDPIETLLELLEYLETIDNVFPKHAELRARQIVESSKEK